METIFKLKNQYVLTDRGFKRAVNLMYQDKVFDISSGSIELLDQSPAKIFKTPYKNYIFNDNFEIKYKDFMSPADDLYSINKVKYVDTTFSYLYIEKNSINIVPKNIVDFSESLYMKKYDITNVIEQIYCKQIDVPKQFLLKALKSGVPDAKIFNSRLNQYLLKNKFEDIDSFKRYLIETYCKRIPKNIPIHLLYPFIIILLTNSYSINDENNSVIIKLNSYSQSLLSSVISFLQKYEIFYSVTKDKEIVCHSSFLYNLYNTEFYNLEFLLNCTSHIKEFILMLKSYNFLTASEHTLHSVQEFLFRNNILSHIEEFGDNDSYILSFIKSFIETPHGYYLPISGVETIDDLALQITIN